MNDSEGSKTRRRVWVEIEGSDPSENEVAFDSFDPRSGGNCGFLDILVAWQIIGDVMIETLAKHPEFDVYDLSDRLERAKAIVLNIEGDLDDERA